MAGLLAKNLHFAQNGPVRDFERFACLAKNKAAGPNRRELHEAGKIFLRDPEGHHCAADCLLLIAVQDVGSTLKRE